MIIKIIKGVYGHREGGKIVPKTPNSEPFEVPYDRATRLISKGVAICVGDEYRQEESTADSELMYSTEMTRNQLVTIAAGLGLEVPKTFNKSQIVEMLDKALKAPDDDGDDDDQPPAPEAVDPVL